MGDIQISFPTQLGEQLAFAAAGLTALIGLLYLFMPGQTLKLFGLKLAEGRQDGLSEIRSFGGLMFGLGLAAILLGQPFVYLTLGAGLAISAFARVVSILSDHAVTLRNCIFLVVFAGLASAPIAYFFSAF